MLVLTRKQGETIQIGEARVYVIRSGRSVRIGIDAPPHIQVFRGELTRSENLLRRMLRARRVDAAQE